MKNDSTEHWLRQKLGGFQHDAPADAWQRLEPNLPKKRRRRPPVFGWNLAAVAAAFGACFLIFKLKNVPPTAPIFEQKQPAALPLIAKTNAESSHFLERKAEVPSPNAMSFRKNQPKIERGIWADSLEMTSQSDSSTPLFADQKFEDKSLPAQTGVFHFEKKLTLEKLPAHAIAPLAETVFRPELQPIFQPILPSRSSAKPRFWFGFEVAPAIFLQNNQSENLRGLAFAEQSAHPGRGWQAGISGAFQPRKNWRFALGIQHLQQTHEAAHTATLRLMDGVVLNSNDPGLKEYEFQYAVISGGQQSKLSLQLQQQDIGTTMPDDKPFMLDMKTVRSSTAWRVPLTVERRFGSGRWQVFLRGGAIIDFAQKSNLQVTHFTEVCQDLCFQSGHIPKIQAVTTTQNSLGWLVGAGIERRFSSRAALRFEPFWAGQKGSLQVGLAVGLLFSN